MPPKKKVVNMLENSDSNNSPQVSDASDIGSGTNLSPVSDMTEGTSKTSITQKSSIPETDAESFSNFTQDTDSDDEIDNEAKEVQITKEFQENVIKYVKIHDLINKKNEELRELKKMKKPCEDFILKYLDKFDVNYVEVTDGKLRKNKSENKVPLSQDIIKDAISKKVSDPKIVEEILKSIEKRPTKTAVNIKRTKNRGPQIKKGKKKN